MLVEYVLIGVLLLAAIFLVIAVTLQKSNEGGLSGTIAGGSETYYGKDKSAKAGRFLNKWTLIITVVFALAVIAAYVIQPDYSQSNDNLDYWKKISEFSSIFS